MTEHWTKIEKWTHADFGYSSCLLELRARVEELERRLDKQMDERDEYRDRLQKLLNER